MDQENKPTENELEQNVPQKDPELNQQSSKPDEQIVSPEPLQSPVLSDAEPPAETLAPSEATQNASPFSPTTPDSLSAEPMPAQTVPPAGIASQPSPQTPPDAPKKIHISKKIIAAVVAVLVLLGIGVSAGLYVYMNNSPQKVLADALTNMAVDLLESKPTKASGTLIFESKGDQPVAVKVVFDGQAEGSNTQTSADITVTYAGKNFNLKTSAIIFGEDEFYFKLENLKKVLQEFEATESELTAFTTYVAPIIEKIDNKWIKVTKDDLGSISGDEETVDKCTAALQNLKLSKNDQSNIKKIFNQNQFLLVNETLTSEEIDGEMSFRYKLDFNDKATAGFAKQIIELESMATVKKDCKITDETLNEALKAQPSENSKKTDAKAVVELWVGKETRRPTQIRITSNDNNVTLSFNTKIKLNAQDISIQKPTGAISITELQTEIESLIAPNISN